VKRVTGVHAIGQAELVDRIREKLASRPHKPDWNAYKLAASPTKPAAYALVVGAGFSYGVVPLVRELVHETIGDWYIPDQDMSSMERPPNALRRHSRDFWTEYNEAADTGDKVELNRKGLPQDPAAAYAALFTYRGAQALFERKERIEREQRKLTYLEQLEARRGKTPPPDPPDMGERFVYGFLRSVMDQGHQHGYGSTGRTDLNAAHLFLAALLEAQQTGDPWNTQAFCRTILTTNFDTLMQAALQRVQLLYTITDRPERGLAPSEFLEDEQAVHLVYTHGSILRHNPASTREDIGALVANADVLRTHLESRDVVIIGYSGWDDSLMRALEERDSDHPLYWCDVTPEPADKIAEFVAARPRRAEYVYLEQGADGLMRALYDALVPDGPDPWQRLAA
jgi:hypothetical protein